MKNLHLMPMSSIFDDNIVKELNKIFEYDENEFVLIRPREKLENVENCFVDASRFSAKYINQHCQEYDKIVLHSLFLSNNDILELSDAAVGKIIWCVWGHDLYDVPKQKNFSFHNIAHETIHAFKKILRGTYIKTYLHRKKVRKKISQFHCIAIGYFYDERIIRKKYGNQVPVCIAPYFSEFSMQDLCQLRDERKPNIMTNILIGHSGFDFLEHEKYLRLLSKYADENIHINMVLTYGASAEKIVYLTNLAHSLFGVERCTILTELLPMKDYFKFLSQMDIAIFPYKHQSALDNTKILAFSGAKLYFDPRGVLYPGFSEGGVTVYDCHEIGKVAFSDFCQHGAKPDRNAPLFFTFIHEKNIEAWKNLLQ